MVAYSGFQATAFQDNAFQIIAKVAASAAPYGGWPKGRQRFLKQPSFAFHDRPLVEEDEPLKPAISDDVSKNINIIKDLRRRLEEEEDTGRRIFLRAKIEEATQAKIREFQRLARLKREEEEAHFILFN